MSYMKRFMEEIAEEFDEEPFSYNSIIYSQLVLDLVEEGLGKDEAIKSIKEKVGVKKRSRVITNYEDLPF